MEKVVKKVKELKIAYYLSTGLCVGILHMLGHIDRTGAVVLSIVFGISLGIIIDQQRKLKSWDEKILIINPDTENSNYSVFVDGEEIDPNKVDLREYGINFVNKQ